MSVSVWVWVCVCVMVVVLVVAVVGVGVVASVAVGVGVCQEVIFHNLHPYFSYLDPYFKTQILTIPVFKY